MAMAIPIQMVQVPVTSPLESGSSSPSTSHSSIPPSLTHQITKFRAKYAAWSMRKQHSALKRIFGPSDKSSRKSKKDKSQAHTALSSPSSDSTNTKGAERVDELEFHHRDGKPLTDDVDMESGSPSNAPDQSTQARHRQRSLHISRDKSKHLKRATARILISPRPPTHVHRGQRDSDHLDSPTHTDRTQKSKDPTAEYRKFAVQAANVAWGFQDHIQLPERGKPAKVGIQAGATRLLVVATVRQGVGFFPSVFRSAFSENGGESGGIGGVGSVKMKRRAEEVLEMGEERKVKRPRTEVTSSGRPDVRL